ncbi:MAG TPA: hypothetical protein VFF68_05155 [Anaerolineaceae bacterium]|nr:hypothetical protein [Anaerolineaceae bacterium]
MSIVLVDMDGVLADFEGGFVRVWRDLHPDKPIIPLEERSTFYLTHQYPQAYRPLIREIFSSRNFYLNLEPMPGCQQALETMLELHIEVFICTTPWLANYYSTKEKFLWVEKVLGRRWLPRLVFTADKTLVTGDVLVDDKPEIQGVAAPQWEHILYDHPYNRSAEGKRRLTWANWQEVLLPVVGMGRVP